MSNLNGSEPKARDWNEAPRGELMRVFNWYSYEKDRKEAHGYVRSWLKKEDSKKVAAWDRIDLNLFVPTYGWVARMIQQGSTMPASYVERMLDHIEYCIINTETEVKVDVQPATNKKSIQDSMAEKQAEFLGEVEGEIDNFIVNAYRDTGYSLYKYCQGHHTANQYMAAVITLCERRLAELALIGKDEQVTEAYTHLGKRDIKAYQTFLNQLVDDAAKYASFKKANRKIRVKKQKPAGEQVAKMKYLKKFEALESVHPTEVVGAQQLWVYNTKNRKLGVYHAVGTTGFSVKGTSLQGYDPELSVQKTLRKPDVTIPIMMKAGKVQLRKVLSDLSTAETALNGRFNDDILLLRVL
jgi:hypothetical protein